MCDDAEEVIEELSRENSFFGRLFYENAALLPPERLQAEDLFATRYPDLGPLSEFVKRHRPTNPTYSEDPCPATVFDPVTKTVYNPATKKTYNPRITAAARGASSFDMYEFLSNVARHETYVPLNFEEIVDYDECGGGEDSEACDFSLANMARLALILNNTSELGYKILEVHSVRRVE